MTRMRSSKMRLHVPPPEPAAERMAPVMEGAKSGTGEACMGAGRTARPAPPHTALALAVARLREACAAGVPLPWRVLEAVAQPAPALPPLPHPRPLPTSCHPVAAADPHARPLVPPLFPPLRAALDLEEESIMEELAAEHAAELEK
jgi:hypothetical protein